MKMGKSNAETGDKSEISALLKALKDADGHVIDAAVSALGKLKLDKRSLEPLVEALDGYPERIWGKTVGQITVILGDMGDKRAVKPLTRIMELGQVPELPWSHADEYINVGALAQEALVHIYADSVSDLIELLKDGDWNMRCLVVSALSKIGDKPAISTLIEVLKDEDENMRWEAANALGKIGDKSAVPALIDVLRDGVELVRHGAIEALGKIGDKSAVPALIDVLKNDELVRWRAAEALGKIGDKSAVPALSDVLNDKNRLVREHATRALKKLGGMTGDIHIN
jgi:HEAT repeat protein